jgi:hypothetical protein
VIVACGAELVRSGRKARAEQAFLIQKAGLIVLIYFYCTPETGLVRVIPRSRRFRRLTKPVILRVAIV